MVIQPVFDIKKISCVKHKHLINGYSRECNEYLPGQELIIITCLWYYHQINIYASANSFDDMDLRNHYLSKSMPSNQ